MIKLILAVKSSQHYCQYIFGVQNTSSCSKHVSYETYFHLHSLCVHRCPPEDGHGVLHHCSPTHRGQVCDQVPGAVQTQQTALVQVLILSDGCLPPAQGVVIVSEGQRALQFISQVILASADLLLGQIGVVVFTKS